MSEELSSEEIEEFVMKHELQPSHFKEEMRAALASEPKGDFLYSLNGNVFSWKRKLSCGLVAKLGQINVKEVSVPETYESILERVLGKLGAVHDKAVGLEKKNLQLMKDRDAALLKADQLADQKAEWEKELYSKFVAVLNTKKERIRLLEEELDLKTVRQVEEGGRAVGERISEVHCEDVYADSTDVDTDTEADNVTEAPELAEQDAAPSTSSATLRRCRDAFSFDSSPGSPASPLLMLPKRSRTTQTGSSHIPRNVLKETTQSEKNVGFELDDDDMEPLTLQEDTQDLIGIM